MLKITGGALRGRNLQTPPGLDTRPTGAKVRQALFNILAQRVPGARLADLFAGPGTLGIEALSRGAAHCLFVESRREVARLLTANLTALGLLDRATVLVADAARPGPGLTSHGPLDLLLADPPYNQGQVARLSALGAAGDFLAPGGLMVIEHSPQEQPTPTPGLVLADQRRYGQTMLSFLARRPAEPLAERSTS
ncbi:MAG: 16S rRNA (guanine(966)-N(2))-methyltransferase RsmD [Pseudomonadota bacterium]